ncbi:Reverse transcriptase domain [Cinara cedri]|uniref:Reverse transcriptase domain n=1 Tax=Cinara cedri TaxID=506608 RepID=A0A5E4NLJ7_9HEMI|nr:Reverse transcriptase domain [Cinara cedri]
MVLKPGKPLEQLTSYRLISLLPSISKLFEKQLLKRLKPLIKERQLIPEHQFGFRNKPSTIDQVHRVINVISKALEEKKYCSGLPHTWCAFFVSFLAERQIRVIDWKNISAGVPQGSVIGSILYLLYTADIPTKNYSMTAKFADDTAMITTNEDQQTATDWLQRSINNISNWTKRWKIKINSEKSVHVNYTLRKTVYKPVLLDQQSIPQCDSEKYLGMHLHFRLNWKHHARQKKMQIKRKCDNYIDWSENIPN